MKYSINEGTIIFPSGVEDRTFNIFQSRNFGEGEYVNIVINRDKFADGEKLDTYFDRQIEVLKKTLRSMTIVSKRDTLFGEQSIPAIEINVKCKDAATGKIQYQRQVMSSLDGLSVLVFTLTTPSPISEKLKAQWDGIIASFSSAPIRIGTE